MKIALMTMLSLFSLTGICQPGPTPTRPKPIGLEPGSAIQSGPRDDSPRLVASYFALIGLTKPVRERINQTIEDEGKLLFLGAYDEGGYAPKRSTLLKTHTAETLTDLMVSQSKIREDRFLDSLVMDTTFCSSRLLSVRFFNLQNTSSAKDVFWVVNRVFDLQTGLVVPLSELVVDTAALKKIANTYFQKSRVTTMTGKRIQFDYADPPLVGLNRRGMLVQYPYKVMLTGDNYDTEVLIPWAAFAGKGILNKKFNLTK